MNLPIEIKYTDNIDRAELIHNATERLVYISNFITPEEVDAIITKNNEIKDVNIYLDMESGKFSEQYKKAANRLIELNTTTKKINKLAVSGLIVDKKTYIFNSDSPEKGYNTIECLLINQEEFENLCKFSSIGKKINDIESGSPIDLEKTEKITEEDINKTPTLEDENKKKERKEITDMLKIIDIKFKGVNLHTKTFSIKNFLDSVFDNEEIRSKMKVTWNAFNEGEKGEIKEIVQSEFKKRLESVKHQYIQNIRICDSFAESKSVIRTDKLKEFEKQIIKINKDLTNLYSDEEKLSFKSVSKQDSLNKIIDNLITTLKDDNLNTATKVELEKTLEKLKQQLYPNNQRTLPEVIKNAKENAKSSLIASFLDNKTDMTDNERKALLEKLDNIIDKEFIKIFEQDINIEFLTLGIDNIYLDNLLLWKEIDKYKIFEDNEPINSKIKTIISDLNH